MTSSVAVAAPPLELVLLLTPVENVRAMSRQLSLHHDKAIILLLKKKDVASKQQVHPAGIQEADKRHYLSVNLLQFETRFLLCHPS
jgi:hypothetical protein